ncbi:MAG TPA: CYCXC family (seleno)protein [Acidobacteriaceae bacterium]|nr:CYCXC family (seleno)protein [Acidobacteriaceae bacterium]
MKRISLTVAVGLIALASYAQWSNPMDDIPAYHPFPPANVAALKPVLQGKQLTGPYFRYAWQVVVYKEAAKIPAVLYQLPCYCRCDRALGHSSLLSCYQGTHAATCSTCAKEEAFAYEMTQRGWTPKQIREAIERKAYDKIDLEKLGRS